MSEPLEQEDKRPETPVVAVLVPVVITMTAEQAAEYASFYGLEKETFDPGTPGGVTTEGGGMPEGITDLQERCVSEAIFDALTLESTGDQLWSLVTVTTLPEEVVPAGEPFPGRKGFVTGLCGHAVAGSEWAAGFRTCERCHAVQA
jgi:hypothetical protein